MKNVIKRIRRNKMNTRQMNGLRRRIRTRGRIRFKREDKFVEYNIPRNENGMRLKIKHLITLHIERITKESTPPCSGRKFSSRGSNNGGKTFTTKSPQVFIRRRMFKKKFIRGFIVE